MFSKKIIIPVIFIIFIISVGIWFLIISPPIPYGGGVSAKITPYIYSVDYAIAILNEEGTFDIELYNYEYSAENITIQLLLAGETQDCWVLQLEPNSAMNKTITHSLSYLGFWTAKVNDATNHELAAYSFQTLSRSDALAKTEPPPTDWVTILTLVTGTLFGTITAVLAVLNYRKKKHE